MTISGEGQISTLVWARGRVRPVFAVAATAIAGVIAGVVTLGIHISWGTPGEAESSAPVVIHGTAHAGLGLVAPSGSWSLSAAFGPGVAAAGGCPSRFMDAAGALPSTCGD